MQFIEYFNCPSTQVRLKQILRWLRNNCEEYVPTVRATQCTSELVIGMWNFQQNLLDSGPGLNRFKIPGRLFLDLNEGGSLCRMLNAMYRLKFVYRWRRFYFDDPAQYDKNVEMVRAAKQALIDGRFLTKPVVYVANSVGFDNYEKAIKTIELLEWTLELRREFATHVLHPEPQGVVRDTVRPVLHDPDEEKVMVHYVFFPDSYDTWVDAEEDVDAKEFGEHGPAQQRHVSITWLFSSHAAVELLDETDYEIDEYGNWRVHDTVPVPKKLRSESFVRSTPVSACTTTATKTTIVTITSAYPAVPPQATTSTQSFCETHCPQHPPLGTLRAIENQVSRETRAQHERLRRFVQYPTSFVATQSGSLECDSHFNNPVVRNNLDSILAMYYADWRKEDGNDKNFDEFLDDMASVDGKG